MVSPRCWQKIEQNRLGLFSGTRSAQTGQVSRRAAARAASAARSLSVSWIVVVMDSRGVVVRVSRAARRVAVVVCCGAGCGWVWANTALTCSRVAWAGRGA